MHLRKFVNTLVANFPACFFVKKIFEIRTIRLTKGKRFGKIILVRENGRILRAPFFRTESASFSRLRL